jgi:glutathionylspermidine synthase
MKDVQWIEPMWKMMWSNKALLAVLWEMFPEHALLLPAFLDGPRGRREYVRKPLLGGEGEGVVVVQGPGSRLETNAERCVYQKLARLGRGDGNYAVLGSWLVDGKPAGMGIRESRGLVTNNQSRFVPPVLALRA